MRYLTILIYSLLLVACGESGAGSADQGSSLNTNGVNKGTRAQLPKENPDITLEVEGLQAQTAYLIGMFTDQHYRIDSARVEPGGKIHFTSDEPYPSGLIFVLFNDNSNIQMLVDTDQTFSMKTRKSNLVGDMQVEGSQENELLYDNLKYEQDYRLKFDRVNRDLRMSRPGSEQFNKLKAEQDALVEERKAYLESLFEQYPNTFFTSFKRAGQNPESQLVYKKDGTIDTARQIFLYRRAFWDGVDFNDDRLLSTPVISNKLERYINDLTPRNPDSIIASATYLIDQVQDKPQYFKYFANYIVLNYEPSKTKLMDPQAVFVYMIQNYFTNERAFWSDSLEIYALQQRAHEMAASLVGKKGPDVKAKNPQGKMKSIYEMDAPYIVVYMFNPDCEHCAEETPKLVQFHREWKNKGVDVFGIGLDTNEEEWKAYIRKHNMPWTNVFDPTNRAIYAKYYVDITPEIYVLNPDRTIIAKNLKVHQIAEVIRRDMRKKS